MTVRPARISRGAIIGGQFRLERLLGQGGMSAVWAARDLRLGRTVAVKLLGPEAMAKPVLRQRFAREARITRRIRSPHVAHVIADGATSAGVPFVVMELLEGESLGAHLAHVGRCSLVTAGEIIEQVCRALSSAHVAGLVHRDVKPANIFLTQQPNGDLFVRLLDFGIAKELLFGTSGLTQSGEVLGTADYMSAEQLCSPDSVTPAADIWSLGVVLYEMLTGQRPFDENTFPMLALRIAEGSFVPASQLCPDLPPELDDVLAHALAPDPRRRYATAAELGSAFLRVVRAHSSDSVVRPDVMRVLYAYSERQHAQDSGAPEQDRIPYDDTSAEPTLRERLSGIVLVVLCIAVVATSWLATTALDNERADGRATAGAMRHAAAPATPRARAAPTPPSAAATSNNSETATRAATSFPPLSAAAPAASQAPTDQPLSAAEGDPATPEVSALPLPPEAAAAHSAVEPDYASQHSAPGEHAQPGGQTLPSAQGALGEQVQRSGDIIEAAPPMRQTLATPPTAVAPSAATTARELGSGAPPARDAEAPTAAAPGAARVSEAQAPGPRRHDQPHSAAAHAPRPSEAPARDSAHGARASESPPPAAGARLRRPDAPQPPAAAQQSGESKYGF